MLPPVQMQQLFNAVKEAGSTSAVWTEFPNGNHMESFDICRATVLAGRSGLREAIIYSGIRHAKTPELRCTFAPHVTLQCRKPRLTGLVAAQERRTAAAVKDKASKAAVSSSG